MNCQQNAVRKIRGERANFFQNENYKGIWTSTNKPPVEKVKIIEAHFITFRDYVQLNLLSLQTMVNVYKKDKVNADQYRKWLKEDALEAVQYAEFAYNWILYLHTSQSKNYCKETLQCETGSEGNKLKADCNCYFEASMHKGQQCHLKGSLLKDGKQIGGYIRKQLYALSQDDAIKKYLLFSLADSDHYIKRNNAKIYLYNMQKSVTTYWQNEILDLIPTWKKVANPPVKSVEPPKSVNVGSLVRGALGKLGDSFKVEKDKEDSYPWEKDEYRSERKRPVYRFDLERDEYQNGRNLPVYYFDLKEDEYRNKRNPPFLSF